MNTILVVTDFTIRAQQAAEFALQIAIKTEADLVLCHAIEIVDDEDEAEKLSWPIADNIALKQDSLMDLRDLSKHLKNLAQKSITSYQPSITCVSEFGKLAPVTASLVKEKNVDLVVMGAHKSTGFNRFLMGSHTHEILDKVNCPVLLLPEGLNMINFSTITYATDLTFSDTLVISYLAKIASAFKTEILVSHISSKGFEGLNSGKVLLRTLNELYPDGEPKISYINIKGDNVAKCLTQLTTSSRPGILTLVHKRYGFLQGLFHSSISKKMADTAKVPLLVMPYSFSVNVTDLTNELIERYSYNTDELR